MTVTPVPNRSTFEARYAGQAPWDIGRPNKGLVDVAGRIAGSVLDACCGTGGSPCTSLGGAVTSSADGGEAHCCPSCR